MERFKDDGRFHPSLTYLVLGEEKKLLQACGFTTGWVSIVDGWQSHGMINMDVIVTTAGICLPDA